MKQRTWLGLVVMLVAAGWWLVAQNPPANTGGASYDEVGLDKKISPKMLEWFRAGVPKDATGLAIVQAQVLSIRTARYCPLGSPKCGSLPTCGHPNLQWATTASFKVIAPLIKRQRPVVPATLEQVLLPPGTGGIHAGDMVWVAFHSLSTNQQPRLGRVEIIESLRRTNAPPAAPVK